MDDNRRYEAFMGNAPPKRGPEGGSCVPGVRGSLEGRPLHYNHHHENFMPSSPPPVHHRIL